VRSSATSMDLSRGQFATGLAVSAGVVLLPRRAVAMPILAPLAIIGIKAVVRGLALSFLGRTKLAARAEQLREKSTLLSTLITAGTQLGILPNEANKAAALIAQISSDVTSAAQRLGDSTLAQYLSDDLAREVAKMNFSASQVLAIEKFEFGMITTALLPLHPMNFSKPTQTVQMGGITMSNFPDFDLQEDKPVQNLQIQVFAVRQELADAFDALADPLRKAIAADPGGITGFFAPPIRTSTMISGIMSAARNEGARVSGAFQRLVDLAYEISPLVPTAKLIAQNAEAQVSNLVNGIVRAENRLTSQLANKTFSTVKSLAVSVGTDYTILDNGASIPIGRMSIPLRPAISDRPLHVKITGSKPQPTPISFRMVRYDVLQAIMKATAQVTVTG